LIELESALNKAICKYEDVIIMGDYNANMLKENTESREVKEFSNNFDLSNIIKKPNFFKEIDGSLIDLILTNRPRSFLGQNIIDTGISDFHRLIYGVLPGTLAKFKKKVIKYRSFRKFNEEAYLNDIALSSLFDCADIPDPNVGFTNYIQTLQTLCDTHAPIKTKYINRPQLPIMNSGLRKAVAKKSMLQHRYNKRRDDASK
jgi:hypothetical protein